MNMLRSAGKAAGKKIGHAKAMGASKALEKAYRQAMRPKRTIGQRIKSGARNIVKGIPKGLGIGLAGYGAYNLGKDIAGKFKGKDKAKKTNTKKFKNNREKWASEESYVPQSQRKQMGGPVYNRGRKIPGMRYGG